MGAYTASRPETGLLISSDFVSTVIPANGGVVDSRGKDNAVVSLKVLFNGLASIGADAAANLIREFLLKRITSHVPAGENGEP